MPEVTLIVSGLAHRGWQSVEITQSMEQPAHSFRVGLTDRWRIDQTPREIAMGAACTVQVDGEDLIRGHINVVQTAYAAGEHAFVIEGRDPMGDVVDCVPVGAAGDWRDVALVDLVSRILDGFGVTAQAGKGTFKRFRSFALQPGETAWNAIERATRLRGVLPLSDGLGRLVLTRPSTESIGVIEQGVNVLSANGNFDDTRMFTEYAVIGQSAGDDYTEPLVSAGSKGFYEDIKLEGYRKRPTLIVAEADGDKDDYDARARYEATVRFARARRVTYRVQGWRVSDGGPLWQPNRLVRIADPILRLDVEWIIAGVRFIKDSNNGTVTELTVMPRDAFAAEPVIDTGDLLP